MTDCIHLKAGTQRTHVVWGSWHLCLDCAADTYLKHHDAALAGVYYHVVGAKKDNAEERRVTPRRD